MNVKKIIEIAKKIFSYIPLDFFSVGMSDFFYLKKLIIAAGGEWVEGKPFMVSIRDDTKIDKFNDIFLYLNNNKVYKFIGSTDPGLKMINDPFPGQEHCAIVSPGMYNNLWGLMKRRNFAGRKNFEVLQQYGKIKVARDYNKNGKIDDNSPIQEGLFAIQFHPGGFTNIVKDRRIGSWSAACQISQMISDYNAIMNDWRSYQKRMGKKKQLLSYWLTTINNRKMKRFL